MATQLGRVTVSLQAESGLKLRGLGGEALHAFFFRILKQYSFELASKIHNDTEQRRFSLTPPLRDCELSQGYTIVSPGTTLSFDISFLTEELLMDSMSVFLNLLQEGHALNIAGRPVVIRNIDLCEGSFSSFATILSNASASQQIALEFVTPTSFRKGEIQVIFPQPELVFSSLRRRWNAFSDTNPFGEQLTDFTPVKVSNYNLRTELVHFSKYKIVGFKGKVEYELPRDASEAFLRAMNAMADFACYCGVGAKTSMGMGQVRRVDTGSVK